MICYLFFLIIWLTRVSQNLTWQKENFLHYFLTSLDPNRVKLSSYTKQSSHFENICNSKTVIPPNSWFVGISKNRTFKAFHAIYVKITGLRSQLFLVFSFPVILCLLAYPSTWFFLHGTILVLWNVMILKWDN